MIVSDKPILFSTPMVGAILEGRKSQTRRIVKSQPKNAKLADHLVWFPNKNACHIFDPTSFDSIQNAFIPKHYSPYGWIGDQLWVRETWREAISDDCNCYVYKAGLSYKCDPPCPELEAKLAINGGWKPSIHMPKKACRLWLEITNVRVERLQDISEEDAIAEGAMFTDFGKDNPGWHFLPVKSSDECLSTARYAFGNLWESINGAGSWDVNPYVWVVEFRRIVA